MTPTTPGELRVALYLRQSKDTDGDELAISRQRDNCLALVARNGWTVAPGHEYVDNDVSASSTKPRPAYQRLIEQVQAGRIDVVVAWNLDRLTRRPREIEDWLDWNVAHGVNLLTSEARDPIDLDTDSGRMMLRIRAAVARQEVERKGRRQRESNAQGRSLGVPPAGRRAFGYTRVVSGSKSVKATRLGADGREWPAYGHEPFEPEASAVRRGYDLLLAGASLRSICRAWNEAGLRTTVGAEWTAPSLRAVLSNPRYAGLVAPPRSATTASTGHNLSLGDLPAGTWEPLVSPETWAAARDLLSDPARLASKGRPRRSLLSGIAKCGVCGKPVKAGATRAGVRNYRCGASPHLSRKAEDADHYIAEVAIERLSRPDAVRLLMRRDAPDVEGLRAELRAVQQAEANVVGMVARGLTSMRAAEASLLDVRRRIGELEAAMTDAGKVDALAPLVAAGDVRAVWDALDVDRQRAVVKALMAVEMLSPGRGSRPPRDEVGRLAHAAATLPITWHE